MARTTELQYAPTRNGFAIALTTGTYRTGGTYYEVVRVDRQHREIVLHTSDSETVARQLANKEWTKDRG